MAKGLEGNKIRTITCAGCGETVTRRARPGQTYCSLTCYRSSSRPQRRTGSTRACEQCSAEFYAPGHRAAEARFCGSACANKWQGRGKVAYSCKVCTAEFRWSPSRSRHQSPTYCSLACRDKDPDVRSRLIAMATVGALASLQASFQRGRISSAEVIGYAILDSLGVEYERQAPFKGKFTPDATVPSTRLIVQFDGDYWHDRKGTSTEARIRHRVALDQSQDAYIRACGWQVVRLWESDLKNDPEGCAEKVRQHLCLPS